MASKTDIPADQLEWPELESLVAELAAHSRAEIALESFAAELLDRTTSLLSAVGGSVWLIEQDGTPRLVQEKASGTSALHTEALRRRTRLLAQETEEMQFSVCSASSVEQNGDELAPGEEWLVVVSPVHLENRLVGLVELIQRPTRDVDILRGYRRFLELVCQTFSDFLAWRELRQLRHAQSRSEHFAAFVQNLHRTLDLKAVAYELANEGRRLVGCDRISVAMRCGNGFRLLAVSGVDTIERRSAAVRELEKLVAVVAKAGEPMWYENGEKDLSPQVLQPLELYLDESHARSVGVIPLCGPSQEGKLDPVTVFAALVIEQFGGRLDSTRRDAAQSVGHQGQLALLNGLRYQTLPTLPFARQRNVLGRRSIFWSRRTIAATAGAILLGVLWLVPSDFSVHAQGELQPLNRRQVFAPMDGRVTVLLAKHGERVRAGDTLLQLSSPKMDIEIQQVQGEYEASRKRLSVIESSLLKAGVTKERDSDHAAQLAAEQEELTQLIESQRAQLALLADERKRLVVRSPMDGEVLTWDIEQLLKDRPVERGQALLSVGDLAGQWVAEVQVPDDRISFLLDAESATSGPLPVTFQMATDRRKDYAGTVRTIAARTEVDEDHRPVVNTTISLNDAAIPDPRPGATIYARIHCGRKPLGYVWFHQLLETLRGLAFYWLG